jgi:acyl-[acyl-carrier-protein] desaturase
MLLESYLLITDNGDHKERSRRRKSVVEHGFTHGLQGPFEAMVYTTIQELATKAFYLHAATFCEPEEPELSRALRRIAKDETRHYAFYRDVVKAHLEAEPDYVMPLADVLVHFQMPGHIIDDFAERSEVLAERQVFGPEQFYQDVLEVLWGYWEIGKLTPASEEARLALRRLRAYRAALRALSRRLARVS